MYTQLLNMIKCHVKYKIDWISNLLHIVSCRKDELIENPINHLPLWKMYVDDDNDDDK